MDFEAGGHRIQRVPPTERKGRVHTSSVTVAVLDPSTVTNDCYTQIGDNDFEVEWFSGTGAGGQHRNKHQNSCRMIHLPTGVTETRQGRKREANLRDAKQAILKKLRDLQSNELREKVSTIRKGQVGSGMRGDKIRTYRFQDDQVVDHLANKKARCSKVMRGYFDLLWK